MRHLRFALCAVFLLASVAASADSIPVFQITFAEIDLFPETGAMGFTFIGPGIGIDGVGAFECPSGWCVNHFTAGGTPIDFGSFVPNQITVQIGGKTYSEAVLNAWTMNPFKALFVPDSGSAATLNGNGLIQGSINTGTFQFEIKVPVGALELGWVQSGENPSDYTLFPSLFVATAPSTVPEPSSVALLVTGLAGILSTAGLSRRKSRQN